MIDPVVDADWLRDHLDVVTVCDVRSRMGGADPYTDFLDGHLPRAILVDLDAVLADPPAPVIGRHPLPTPARFASALGALGVGDGATVVATDDRGGAIAARLVWMLRIIGQPAALLDGGNDAWTGPLERGSRSAEHPGAVERTVVDWPADAIADADAVVRCVDAGGTVIDSRSPERYRGEVEPIDAVAGHIPGAVNLPFVENLGAGGRFLDPPTLADRFADLGDDVIVACGSGVTACHNAIAMERAGLARPRVYVGSWSGWSTDPGRPVATGG